MTDTPDIQQLDARRNAVRPDLADARLEGRVTTARFVEGVTRQVRFAVIPMRKAPDAALGFENEALLGELVWAFDEADGWAWVQLQRDGYVGYVPANGLAAHVVEASHRVQVPGTFVYSTASIKQPPLAHLSLNARVAAADPATDGAFLALAGGGFVHARHVAPVTTFARDFVEVAENLIHTPYLWGGRTRVGLDCSALVQLSLEAAGVPCPRDSDMIAAELGETVPVTDGIDDLHRGDVVCWRGHCGIMIDAVMLLHCNGHHMATAIEPLSQVVRRYRKSTGDVGTGAGEITAIRRLPHAPE